MKIIIIIIIVIIGSLNLAKIQKIALTGPAHILRKTLSM